MSTAVEPTSEMLTLERIRAWAESKAPDAVVGLPADSTECPIACYLTELGVSKPRVRFRDVRWFTLFKSRDDCVIETPALLRKVIDQVDNLNHFYGVTAADLLAIIADLEQRP